MHRKTSISASPHSLSPERFEELFKTYYPVLTVFAYKFIGDMEAARGLVQEMFIHLYEKRDTLTIDQSPKAYLFQATRNRCLNYIKKKKKEKEGLEELKRQSAKGMLKIEDPLEAAEFEEKLFNLIEMLPPACKNVFKLSRFEGKKNADIAEELKISKRTVETQISKALKFLRQTLAQEEGKTSSRSLFLLIPLIYYTCECMFECLVL